MLCSRGSFVQRVIVSPITDCWVLMAGACYLEGRGLAKDESKAAQWWQAAAAQGHADAQYNLGTCVAFVISSRSAFDCSSPITDC